MPKTAVVRALLLVSAAESDSSAGAANRSEWLGQFGSAFLRGTHQALADREAARGLVRRLGPVLSNAPIHNYPAAPPHKPKTDNLGN